MLGTLHTGLKGKLTAEQRTILGLPSRTPEETVTVIEAIRAEMSSTGRWLADCKQIIDQHSGTINKFLGDGFFAYWLEREAAAALVVKALKGLRQEQDKAHPRFRVVLHFGKVFVGGAATPSFAASGNR